MHEPIKIGVRQIQNLCGLGQSEDLSIERDPNTVGSQSITLFILFELSNGLLEGMIAVITHPIEGRGSINPGLLAGSGQCHCLALPRHQNAISLQSGSTFDPTAIFWAIDAIRVDPIILCSSEPSRSHVGQEILKGVPAFADTDATPTVVFVVYSVWIVATVAHVEPRSINRTWPTGMSVLEGKLFCSTTPAARSMTTTQMGRGGDYYVPAKLVTTVASARPSRIPIIGIGILHTPKNSKSPKLLTRDIYQFVFHVTPSTTPTDTTLTIFHREGSIPLVALLKSKPTERSESQQRSPEPMSRPLTFL
jgi:hypothetical protein